MAYSLSFSEEFFSGYGETEIFDMKQSDRPTSVYQAIISLPKKIQIGIARNVMKSPHPVLYINSESFPFDVMDKVRETNTCGTLSSPVDVWIDSEGLYTVDVYDLSEPDEWADALEEYENTH